MTANHHVPGNRYSERNRAIPPHVLASIKVLYRAVNAEKRGRYSRGGPSFLNSSIYLIAKSKDLAIFLFYDIIIL